jgi:hypothetical protein
MKMISRLVAIALVVFGSITGVASASGVMGQVKAVGTISEENVNGGYHARLRVHVVGTCDGSTADIWIVIRSGRTDGVYSHNGVNMKNAYSTLVSAFLSGKNVLIDGFPSCATNSRRETFMDLWNGGVLLY